MSNWTRPQQDDDPHGIQKLLNILRTQQDGDQSNNITIDVKNTGTPSNKDNGSGETSERRSNADLLTDIQSNLKNHKSSTIQQQQQDDLRFISFAQALPHLSRLSKSDEFLQKLLQLKHDQDEFEKSLLKERNSLTNDDDDDDGQAVRKNWDRKALQRWDTLYAIQQEKLQQFGVPCFFATRDPGHVRKQQRVFDVLSGLLE